MQSQITAGSCGARKYQLGFADQVLVFHGRNPCCCCALLTCHADVLEWASAWLHNVHWTNNHLIRPGKSR